MISGDLIKGRCTCMEILTFKDEMIPQAAELLARRHQAERSYFPQLPSRFEQAEHAEQAIRGLKDNASTIGIAAFRSGKMIGYMIAQTLHTSQRGRHAWIDYAAFAIDPNEDEELIRNLYSNLGERLVELGYFRHFVLTPVSNEKVVDAWFRLCFAHEQVHGITELPASASYDAQDPSIRLAGKSDEAAVREMSNLIPIQVASAPTWGASLPETMPDLKDGYAELLDDPSVRYWASFQHDGRIASCMATWPKEASDTNMRIPECCITVSCVATKTEHRGKGLANQLLQVVLHDAKQRGFEYCETDWRMANIPISNFLPQRGFVPYAYRLHRTIDSRILWANGVHTTTKFT